VPVLALLLSTQQLDEDLRLPASKLIEWVPMRGAGR
jgi:hypothetical protein